MKFIPHEYQEYAVSRILELPRCGLFLDMGLGKTVITLTAVNILTNGIQEITKTLVIAPKRVAEDTWTTETGKWDHLADLRVSRVLGTAAQRKAALAREADIYVINRENVVWLVEYLGKEWPFDMVVIDELSSFKGHQSRRFKALRKVIPRSPRVVGLTGTPAPNGLIDLWPQIYLLDRGERLERTIGAYREKYFRPGMTNGYVVYSYRLRPGAEETIREKLSDLCISMRAQDYLTMPELTVNDVRVRLTPAEGAVYRQMEQEQLLELESGTVTALSAGAVCGKLLQMANGAVYDNDGEVCRIHDRKLEALGEILDTSAGQPVLVFYHYRHDYDRLMEAFKGFRPQSLNGPEDIRRWNEGKIPLLLAQPAGMGHGLNLQAGGHIIVWFGLTWSLELYQQANARLYRQGQREAVIVHRLVAEGTMDEEVVKRLESKDMTQEGLMESLKARIRKYGCSGCNSQGGRTDEPL